MTSLKPWTVPDHTQPVSYPNLSPVLGGEGGVSAGDVRGVSMEWLLVSGDWFGEGTVWCDAGRRAVLGGVGRCVVGRGVHIG